MFTEATAPYLWAIGIPVLYLTLMAIGRVLKKQTGVPLGLSFRAFCGSLALYAALTLTGVSPIAGGVDIRLGLGALTIVFSSLVVTAVVRHYVWHLYFERKRQTPMPKLLRQLVEAFVFIAACVLVLRTIYGRTEALTSFIAGSSAVALIVGIAMQNLLGNVVAGVALELARPFKPGDWLIFDSKLAEVMEVNWRSTKLRTNDDTWLDIPNSLIVGHTIINLSFPTKQHAWRITVGVDSAIPPNEVKDLLVKAVAPSVGVLRKPAPKVFLKEFGEFAIIYEIKFSIENESIHNDIFDSVRTNIWYALHRANIRIPNPIHTVQIAKPNALSAALEIPASKRALLRQKAFFQCLEEGEIEHLLGHGRLKRFGRGEPIIVQGDAGSSMFILLNGSARVNLEVNGASQEIATLKDDDYFGEISLLTGEPRTATVIAERDCEVLEIEKEMMGDLFQKNPCLLERLSALLAERRIQMEGVLAATTAPAKIKEVQSAYTARFIKTLTSFFEL